MFDETTFQEEACQDVIEELKPLLQRHWQEIARHKDVIEFDPDYSAYQRLQDVGCLSVITARKDGRLIGYAVYFLHPHLHYRRELWAVSDIFWVAPEHRRGMLGVRLFREAEKVLRARGVSVMHTTTKAAHPAAGKVLEALGHNLIEQGYSKLLKEH